MKKFLLLLVLFIPVYTGFLMVKKINTGAPPYDAGVDSIQDENDSLSWLTGWERPEGPAKVGLQVGHWKNNELPEELEKLRGNTGSSGGGKTEVEVNLKIAEETKKLLESQGIIVDIIPATVPPKYWADAFVAIHADGNLDRSKSGFKAAKPRRDYSGKSGSLVQYIEDEYQSATKLDIDPNVSRNMTGYYAFSWRRFEHAIHPMTAAAILETGFLSSATDRQVIVSKPELSAEGLSNGIIKYLQENKLLN